MIRTDLPNERPEGAERRPDEEKVVAEAVLAMFPDDPRLKSVGVGPRWVTEPHTRVLDGVETERAVGEFIGWCYLFVLVDGLHYLAICLDPATLKATLERSVFDSLWKKIDYALTQQLGRT